MEQIYIVGHTRPDLDSVAAAVGYQKYKEGLGQNNYHAITCDRVNTQTEWIFNMYNTTLPPYIPNISGMNVVLVDHCAPESRPKGWERANIVEVIDHHELKLDGITPQYTNIKPCGSTCSIVTEMIFESKILLSKDIASILLSAILDDTLGLNSPTTIKFDIDMVDRLNDIVHIKNLEQYSRILFEKKDIWHTLLPREIIDEDLREYEIAGKWFSISQVETMNTTEIKKEDIIKGLELLNNEKPFNLRLVMITDLIEEDCILLVVGKDIKLLEGVLNSKIINNSIFLPNVVSRKKQVLPILKKVYGS